MGFDLPSSTSVLHSGVTGASAKQWIEIVGAPTGGQFTLSLWGYTTPPIPWNVTTANLQNILEGLPCIGTGNVLVAGTAGVGYSLTFRVGLANVNVPLMTLAVVSPFTGGTSPAAYITYNRQTITPPGSGTYTLSVYNGATLVGTTAAIAFGASISAIVTALNLILGVTAIALFHDN